MDLRDVLKSFEVRGRQLEILHEAAPKSERNILAAVVVAGAIVALAQTLVEIEISRQENK